MAAVTEAAWAAEAPAPSRAVGSAVAAAVTMAEAMAARVLGSKAWKASTAAG